MMSGDTKEIKKEDIYNCVLCEDVGLRFYDVLDNGILYQHAAKCICKTGELKYPSLINYTAVDIDVFK